MPTTPTVTFDDLKDRVARNFSESRIVRGTGHAGGVSMSLRRGVTRTFRAHWTGFKLFYPGDVLMLRADLAGGDLWSEGYISLAQPSWVLTFRAAPHPARGSSGRPRPDDELANPQHVETAIAQRKNNIDAGLVSGEELIRMEDFDNPLEAIDGFFNYTSLYVLKAVNASWQEIGYSVDPSVGWARDEEVVASLPVEAAIQEGLKKSDIIWLTPETATNRPVPCWFVMREGKVYVLSGERQQIIPGARRLRNAHVVTRWKGRDARLVEFDAAVKVITASDRETFEEIAELLLNKRQSVTGTHEQNLERWMRECVILELTPRM